jgi:hypothetical protein
MTLRLRAVKAALIIGIVVVGTFFSPALFPEKKTIASAKFLTFDSELELSFNTSTVNSAKFSPDGPAVSIPLYIKYRVDVPTQLLTNYLLRIIFLQTFILAAAQVSFTVTNPPTWAAISITPSNPYVNIDNTFQYGTAVLQIAAHADAPAEGFTLRIHATIPKILGGHVAEKSADLDIIFQPGYIPLINVDIENPSRVVSPQVTTTFKITIKNLGNKQTLVTGKIVQAPEGWASLLSQAQITILPGASETLTFSITPPYGFGYHNDLGSILLEFTPQFSPPQNISGYIGTPVPAQIIIRSRGFSTPGFEAMGVLVALAIVIALIAKKQHIRRQ